MIVENPTPAACDSPAGEHAFETRRFRLVREILVIAFFAALAAILQYLSHAHQSSFGAHSDEAAHYVTGLMVRDYLVYGLPAPPREFAEKFYVHYPRVAFGIWPPVFDIASGLWMVLFGAGRSSILSFLLIPSILWCYGLYRVAHLLFGFRAAVIGGTLLASLPATQWSTSTVMLDLLVAVFCLGAMVAYGRFLSSENWRDAVGFGLFASGAILTKYNGLALALVPPLCVLLTKRGSLMRKRVFWIPLAVVLVVAGPWYVVMVHSVLYAMEPGNSGPSVFDATAMTFSELFSIAGPSLFVVAAAGCIVLLKKVRASGRITLNEGLLTSAVATMLATVIFHSFLYPLIEERYLLPIAPSIILLGAFAIRYGATEAPAWTPHRWLPSLLVITLGIGYLAFTFRIPGKKTAVFTQVADYLLTMPEAESRVILVSSDGLGEGMLVSEIAMRDQRPGRVVVRSSKFLAHSRLMGQDYRMLYNSEQELMGALQAANIRVVVADDCSALNCSEHQKLLLRTIHSFPTAWRFARDIAGTDGRSVHIYTLTARPSTANGTIRIDMRPALGKVIEGKVRD